MIAAPVHLLLAKFTKRQRWRFWCDCPKEHTRSSTYPSTYFRPGTHAILSDCDDVDAAGPYPQGRRISEPIRVVDFIEHACRETTGFKWEDPPPTCTSEDIDTMMKAHPWYAPKRVPVLIDTEIIAGFGALGALDHLAL